MQIIQSIQNRIYDIRGERVMLDFDLATLYGVETRALNQAVKRNIERFPEDFMFRLTVLEWDTMRSQIVTAYHHKNLPGEVQLIDNQQKRNIGVTPYAFTEQGVAMLSGVLRSEKAVQMNIAIMRAFVAVRKALLQKADIQEQLKEIKERLGENDTQLSQIYDALENMLDEKAAQKKWDERERIGFRK
jgi:ORF6N domain